MKSDFIVALTQLASERNLPRDIVISALEDALLSAYKRDSVAANQDISVKKLLDGEVDITSLTTSTVTPNGAMFSTKRQGFLPELLEEMYDERVLIKNKTIQHRKDLEKTSKDDIIRMKDDEITFRKEMKLKLSTKMIGETLEQHCEAEFNKLRATGFQNAYFEKDTDAKAGSKGDYIYREIYDGENEVVSIMFDMKNESDEIATKNNWIQESDSGALGEFITEAIAKYPEKVKEYKEGKKGLIGLFMGEVMNLSKGKADPKLCNQMLKEILEK